MTERIESKERNQKENKNNKKRRKNIWICGDAFACGDVMTVMSIGVLATESVKVSMRMQDTYTVHN